MATTKLKIGMAIGGIATGSGLGFAIYISTWNTIEDKLIAESLSLISDDEDYKIALFSNKENSDLKTELSKTTIDHTQNVNDIKKWCESKVKEWYSKDKDKLLKNAKYWFTIPKVKRLRDKLGNDLHTGDEWATKFTEFASKPEPENKFLEALNVGVTSQKLDKNSANGKDKFREWCNAALDLKIYVTDTHKTETNIKTWCLKTVKQD